MRNKIAILGLIVFLPGCAELGLELSDPVDQPGSAAPSAEPAPAPTSEPSSPLSLGPAPNAPIRPPLALPAGAPITLKDAERMTARFRTLHQLATAGLIEEQRYRNWARDNQGAFLLLTAPPPMIGLTATTPPFDQLAEFLRDLKDEREEIANAERSALLDSLMPPDAPRALPRSLPADAAGLRDWMALLDQIGSEGLLPADSVAAEKTAVTLAVSP